VAGQLELATERRSLRPAAGCPMPELTAAVFGETRVSARVVQNQKTARVARPWRAHEARRCALFDAAGQITPSRASPRPYARGRKADITGCPSRASKRLPHRSKRHLHSISSSSGREQRVRHHRKAERLGWPSVTLLTIARLHFFGNLCGYIEGRVLRARP
jgi:hypothetical protein